MRWAWHPCRGGSCATCRAEFYEAVLDFFWRSYFTRVIRLGGPAIPTSNGFCRWPTLVRWPTHGCACCAVSKRWGDVPRDLVGARYFDKNGQRHYVPARYCQFHYTPIWGQLGPGVVKILPFAPGIGCCKDWEKSGKLLFLLFVFLAFVAAPLIFLWWRCIMRPAIEVFHEWRARGSISGQK